MGFLAKQVGVCTASQTLGVTALLNTVMGAERVSQLDLFLSGDDVSKKKPSPLIYTTASNMLNIPPERRVPKTNYCY